ncbi:GNAT family N-acetyltransferase [Beggiatoa alba]|nr:GNAT family N-acetyltransferase [Beggiatoa alba]
MAHQYTIKRCFWKTHQQQLSEVRRAVFINEQNVPEDLEWDGFDETAQHVIALNQENKAIGTGRLKKDGHIGRMALLKEYRLQGIGTAILSALLELAKQQNLKKVYLHAQITALSFYEKQGFVCSSDEFMDAGIPHRSMIKKLVE